MTVQFLVALSYMADLLYCRLVVVIILPGLPYTALLSCGDSGGPSNVSLTTIHSSTTTMHCCGNVGPLLIGLL